MCVNVFSTYLNCKDGDTAGTLGEYVVTRHKLLESVESVPSSQSSTGQGGALDKVKVAGQVNESLLIVGAVLLESTINDTANTSCDGVIIDRAREMGLVELRDDFVANLETMDLAADGLDDACTVRSWDHAVALCEWVLALVVCQSPNFLYYQNQEVNGPTFAMMRSR